MSKLPTIVCSSVVRTSQQGESHGGVYLVDLESGEHRQVLDWNDPRISWEGRGWDRGLRGIAFHGELIYLAASDELFVYDQHFNLVESFRNPYLRHCHEITVERGSLYLTSTGFDSILQFDMTTKRFVRGYHLSRRSDSEIGADIFDPNSASGPAEGHQLHVNNVCWVAGKMYVSGTLLNELLEVGEGNVRPYARIPHTTHNAQPYREGVLCHSSSEDRIVYLTREGQVIESFPLIHYPPHLLTWTHLKETQARQGFGRGLCLYDDFIIAGSSPSTVSVYEFGISQPMKSVALSQDIRNAIHGLEVWPFAGIRD